MYNNYFEHVYSKFWTETSKKYGMEDGVDSIIEILLELHGKSAFEVGIGTGWPIADSLLKSGVKVSGCDISERLIAETQKTYPNMELYAGTIWEAGGGYKQEDFRTIRYSVLYPIQLVYEGFSQSDRKNASDDQK